MKQLLVGRDFILPYVSSVLLTIPTVARRETSGRRITCGGHTFITGTERFVG
jgi:hypothetical protein